MENDFRADIDAVGAIMAVPTILNVVCRVTGMGFAAVARVTPERWVCLAVNDEISFGLKPGGELKVETTICHEVRQARGVIAIDHVAEDELYFQHHTPAMYGFQSYISMPIFLKDGSFYGTLCAIDPKPAKLKNPGVIGMFKLFAELIAFHLDTVHRLAEAQADLATVHAAGVVREEAMAESGRRLAIAEADLLDVRAASELREQFIAVLGHDLRNPLASVSAGTSLLRKTPLDDKATSIVDMMHKSVMRMSLLIDNVMDFARGRLGGGLTLSRSRDPLEPMLRHVIDELQSIHPERRIEAEFDITRTVDADPVRVSQLLSNLLGNALTYGAEGRPVTVKVSTAEQFELAVCNAGAPIPQAAMERLFSPFARGEVRPSQQGLGLGLYIASEIARAHDGTIDVISNEKETCFTFRIPLA